MAFLILLPVYGIIKVIFMLYIFSRKFGKHENVIGTKISTFTVVYLGKPEKLRTSYLGNILCTEVAFGVFWTTRSYFGNILTYVSPSTSP